MQLECDVYVRRGPGSEPEFSAEPLVGGRWLTTLDWTDWALFCWWASQANWRGVAHPGADWDELCLDVAMLQEAV